MKHAAILLAAGFSRRFGSDKRLACVDGEPLLLASLSKVRTAMRDVSHGDLQVVVRARDPLVGPMLSAIDRGFGEVLVQAPTWPVGMGVSIATGLEALLRRGCEPDSVAICLADMPFWEAETLQHLFFSSRPDSICVPLFEGQRGHPVVFGREFFPELLKLRSSRGAGKVLRANPEAVREYPVEDAGVIRDIDRPEDLRHTEAPGAKNGTFSARGEEVPLASRTE